MRILFQSLQIILRIFYDMPTKIDQFQEYRVSKQQKKNREKETEINYDDVLSVYLLLLFLKVPCVRQPVKATSKLRICKSITDVLHRKCLLFVYLKMNHQHIQHIIHIKLEGAKRTFKQTNNWHCGEKSAPFESYLSLHFARFGSLYII